MSSEVSVRVPTSLPSELRLQTPSKAVSGEGIMLKIPADKAEVRTKSNNSFRFVIPNQASLWNGRNSRICFDVAIEADDLKNATGIENNKWSINKNIHSIFRRLRILSGSQELVNIESYNLLCGILMEVNANEDYNNTVGDIMSNTGAIEERKKYIKVVDDEVVVRRFCMHIAGLDLLENTLPLFTNQPWIIELTLAPMEEFLEYTNTDVTSKGIITGFKADGTTNLDAFPASLPTGSRLPTDILLTNITFHTHVLSLSTELELQLRNEFANNKKTYRFTSYEHFSQNSALDTHTIQIPIKKSVVSGLLAVQRDASDVTDYRYVDRLNGKFLYNGLEYYQVVINGQNVPQDRIDTTKGNSEGMQELITLFDKQRATIGSMSITDNSWTPAEPAVADKWRIPSKSIIALDLRKFQTTLISGYNTAQAVGSFMFKARTPQITAHPDNRWEFFVRHSSLIQIEMGRVSVIH